MLRNFQVVWLRDLPLREGLMKKSILAAGQDTGAAAELSSTWRYVKLVRRCRPGGASDSAWVFRKCLFSVRP
jgi:hypothetical protein